MRTVGMMAVAGAVPVGDPVIYGAAHFYRTMPGDYLSNMGQDVGIARMLEIDYPGRTFVVIPLGGRLDIPPGATVRIDPDDGLFPAGPRKSDH
jgi:hypothetical protein